MDPDRGPRQRARRREQRRGLSGFAEVSLKGTIDMREMAIGPCISLAGFVPGM
jgi:hypothetical protein